MMRLHPILFGMLRMSQLIIVTWIRIEFSSAAERTYPYYYCSPVTVSHADFGAATHPGVEGGTHRRRTTFERC